FARGADVQAAGETHRRNGERPYRRAFHPAETAYDVPGELGMDLAELAVVQDVLDYRVHVVGLVRRVRYQRVKLGVLVGRLADLIRAERRRQHRRVLEIVRGQVGQQVASEFQAVLLVRGLVVRYAGLDVVRVRAAQVL